MMKPNRNIRYIKPDEDVQDDYLEKEIELYSNSTHEETFRRFMKHQAALFALLDSEDLSYLKKQKEKRGK